MSSQFGFHPERHDEPDLIVALEAAKLGGGILLEHFKEPHEIDAKSHGDFVTDADREANEAICDFLSRRRQEYAIHAEESASPNFKEKPVQPTWLVDPLDSTKGFIKMLGPRIWSVMIALRYDLQTTLGVIYFPLTQEFHYAIKGKGAFINGQQVHTSKDMRKPSEMWIEMNAFADSTFETPEFAKLRERLRSPAGVGTVTSDIPHSGVVTRMINPFIPAGQRLDAVIHDNNPAKPKQEPWDIAPAQLILEEAGGVFVNTKGERISPFKPEVIIAANNQQTADFIRNLLAA